MTEEHLFYLVIKVSCKRIRTAFLSALVVKEKFSERALRQPTAPV